MLRSPALSLALALSCGAPGPPSVAPLPAAPPPAPPTPPPAAPSPPPATPTPVAAPAPDADPIAAWFAAHPEVLAATALDLGHTGARYLWLGTTARSLHCVRRHGANEPSTWCWEDGRTVDRVQVVEVADDDPLVFFLAAWSGGAGEAWALRFPAAERAALRRPGPPPPDATWPVWYPPATARRRPPRWRPPGTGWAPLVTVSASDLEPLWTWRIAPVPTTSPDLTALQLSASSDIDPAAVTTRTCVRRRDRWACSAPSTFDGYRYVRQDLDLASTIPARAGGDWLVLQRSTLQDGGNGEFSGAGGDALLELHRFAGPGLEHVTTLPIGAMEWLTLRRERAGFPSYHRWTKRWHHAHAPAGPDCLRIAPATVEQAMTDFGFVTERRLKRQAGAFTRWPVPDTLTPEGGAIPLPAGPSGPPPTDELMDMDRPMPSWDLAGLWRLGPDGAMTRLSRDPAAICP